MEHKVSEIPTLDQLAVQYGIGRAYVISDVPRHRTYGYANYKKTKLGVLEESEWRTLVRKAIEQAGETQLHQWLTEWYKEHTYLQQTKQEFEDQVLDAHARQLFNDPYWADFVPFNRKYRPEHLEGIPLHWVENECCHVPGQVTEEQLQRGLASKTIHCAKCGRWSAFTIMTNEMEVLHHECDE